MADIRKPLNVYNASPTPGQIAFVSATKPELKTCIVDPDTPLVANTGNEEEQSSIVFHIVPSLPVQLMAGSSEIPRVTFAFPVENEGEEGESWPEIYGLVIHDPKRGNWDVGDVIQVAKRGAVMWGVALEDMERGDKIKPAIRFPEGITDISQVVFGFVKLGSEGDDPTDFITFDNGYVGETLDDVSENGMFRLQIAVPLMEAPEAE